MPIYEYECKACGYDFESLQKITDEPLKDCPDCKAPALQKRVSATGFRLKGSGWYETDFKGGGKKKNLAGEPGEAKKTNTEPAKSGKEAKPAADAAASTG